MILSCSAILKLLVTTQAHTQDQIITQYMLPVLVYVWRPSMMEPFTPLSLSLALSNKLDSFMSL
jgi:hypothetical protein